MKPYEIIDNEWIKLTEGPYAGIIYKYGRVQLIEEDESLRVRFEYQLKDGSTLDSSFVQHIGPILTDLINEGVRLNSIVYTGGTDETRAKDISELDSQ